MIQKLTCRASCRGSPAAPASPHREGLEGLEAALGARGGAEQRRPRRGRRRRGRRAGLRSPIVVPAYVSAYPLPGMFSSKNEFVAKKIYKNT